MGKELERDLSEVNGLFTSFFVCVYFFLCICVGSTRSTQYDIAISYVL